MVERGKGEKEHSWSNTYKGLAMMIARKKRVSKIQLSIPNMKKKLPKPLLRFSPAESFRFGYG